MRVDLGQDMVYLFQKVEEYCPTILNCLATFTSAFEVGLGRDAVCLEDVESVDLSSRTVSVEINASMEEIERDLCRDSLFDDNEELDLVPYEEFTDDEPAMKDRDSVALCATTTTRQVIAAPAELSSEKWLRVYVASVDWYGRIRLLNELLGCNLFPEEIPANKNIRVYFVNSEVEEASVLNGGNWLIVPQEAIRGYWQDIDCKSIFLRRKTLICPNDVILVFPEDFGGLGIDEGKIAALREEMVLSAKKIIWDDESPFCKQGKLEAISKINKLALQNGKILDIEILLAVSDDYTHSKSIDVLTPEVAVEEAAEKYRELFSAYSEEDLGVRVYNQLSQQDKLEMYSWRLQETASSCQRGFSEFTRLRESRWVPCGLQILTLDTMERLLLAPDLEVVKKKWFMQLNKELTSGKKYNKNQFDLLAKQFVNEVQKLTEKSYWEHWEGRAIDLARYAPSALNNRPEFAILFFSLVVSVRVYRKLVQRVELELDRVVDKVEQELGRNWSNMDRLFMATLQREIVMDIPQYWHEQIVEANQFIQGCFGYEQIG